MIEFLGYYGLGMVSGWILIRLLRVMIKNIETGRSHGIHPPQDIPQFKNRRNFFK